MVSVVFPSAIFDGKAQHHAAHPAPRDLRTGERRWLLEQGPERHVETSVAGQAAKQSSGCRDRALAPACVGLPDERELRMSGIRRTGR